MKKEHPARAVLRKQGKFSETVESADLMRAIEKANARHYADTPMPDLEIKSKADIKNSKHRASPEAMDRLNEILKDD